MQTPSAMLGVFDCLLRWNAVKARV